jgi:hypothetical protein
MSDCSAKAKYSRRWWRIHDRSPCSSGRCPAAWPSTRWLRLTPVLGEVDGPGRPLELGRPVGHAYILRVVAEFQGFVRDLHNLGVEKLVDLSNPDPPYRALLAPAQGRLIDRGNADARTIESDFRRLGISGFRSRLRALSPKWDQPPGRRTDQADYQALIELRNALAHGNQGQLDRLRARGVADTITWTRARLPGLNRTARALDRLVWDHMVTTFGQEPW